MGKKAKSSRKGKKAWRANISTEDIHDFYEKSTTDALSGGSLSSVPSDSLFFVHKSTEDLSAKTKIEKNREKVLRCDSILQKNPFIETVPSSRQRKIKKVPELNVNSKGGDKDTSTAASQMVDLWKDECDGKARKSLKPTVIPAVEVEPPGCSFNPEVESHQDALAQAVADEMQKVYKDELGPEPVPLIVEGEVIDEEERYFLEADDGDDEDLLADGTELNENGELEMRCLKTKPVTRVELNRRSRRKELLRKEAEAKKVVQISKEIDGISDIIQEIEREDGEKQRKHLRKVVAKAERLKSRPPRLGKHKFEPAPLQVLLSEEITGSIRQIKGCCTLAKDRYKSLEKRGLVVPSAKRRKVGSV
ncbi:hypothetical protein MLD38_003629 [Melastoma candidum]|uniref:Uncharacterized protein n=1 Tax=Melastoma candidum TaxID=119954 RepID=A0ACB9S4R4_9MYRT|nr:hypothetical protein MLD38_003629 [Melastoma candidum]